MVNGDFPGTFRGHPTQCDHVQIRTPWLLVEKELAQGPSCRWRQVSWRLLVSLWPYIGHVPQLLTM